MNLSFCLIDLWNCQNLLIFLFANWYDWTLSNCPAEIPAKAKTKMHSSLFHCPECGYQCSPSALSCLNCGRIFRVSQTVYTRPRTSPVRWVVTFLIVGFAVILTISLILNANRQTVELGATQNNSESLVNQTAVETRRKFALGMQGMAIENSGKHSTDLIMIPNCSALHQVQRFAGSRSELN